MFPSIFLHRRTVMKRYTFMALLVVILITLLASISMALENYKAPKFGTPPVIDGKLNEWSNVPGVFLTGSLTVTGQLDGTDVYKDWETLGVETWESDADLSATFYAAWDDSNFYFACLAKDEKHENKGAGDGIWNGDALQLAIDPTNAKKDYGNWVYEYGYALTTNPSVFRWSVNPASTGETSTFAIVRDDAAGTTTYEIAIPGGDIAPAVLAVGKVLGFSIVLNENDASGGQGGWLGWGPHAIVYGKNATKTNDLTFVADVASAVSSGSKLSTTWGSIKN